VQISGTEKNIGTFLDEVATRHDKKKAIHFDFEDFSLSYRELNQKVNRIANALRVEGIEKGDHVAVMLPNCPEFPITWLALAKLGAVMIPINTRYQFSDLVYVLHDSHAGALIIDTESIPTFRAVQPKCHAIVKIFRVGEGEEDMGRSLIQLSHDTSSEFVSIDVTPDDLMNIQYTSGTTGLPKGCITTHEYWLTLGRMRNWMGMTEDDVFLTMSPFYYMDPQWELLMTLGAGGTLVVVRRMTIKSYLNLIRKHRVTVAWGSHLLLNQPESRLDKDHHLRFVLLNAMPPHLHKRFEERFNVIGRETYGMTEIGACMVVRPEDDTMTGSGSVGKPLESREVRIVNQDGHDVVRGEIGELLVKGPGLFKGYYNKPKETAEAFDGEYFRTGDLFREDGNGYYYIVGRERDMIRRSGDNISAAELEVLLRSHPKILDAAIVPVPDTVRGEEVKAYIMPMPGENPGSIPPEEVIAFCLKHIAKFKVPRYVEYREDFPRSATERIQKHVLIAEKKDLSSGCYDSVERRWRR